jgi:AcrR family transcriptional regulator
MATNTERRTPARVPLSRERVLRAALDLADRDGIEALSMRRLGQELGVEAMSLYNHVANKDDILAGLVDIVVGEIDLPSRSAGWKSAMRHSAISAHDILLRHRWACALINSATGDVGPARRRYMDAVLGCLRDGGFSVELTHHGYHALDSHIIGFTLWQLGFPFASDDEMQDLAGDFLRQLPAEDFPHLAEHVLHHLRESSDEDQSEFDFGLDLILDGLERAREREASS